MIGDEVAEQERQLAARAVASAFLDFNHAILDAVYQAVAMRDAWAASNFGRVSKLTSPNGIH